MHSDERIEICCVISNNEEAYGLERARNAGIDNLSINHNNFSSRKEFEEALIKSLSKYNPDLIVLAGFMRILSEVFVNRYSDRLVNIHPSLLPKYKGLETHKRVIENKENTMGLQFISWMRALMEVQYAPNQRLKSRQMILMNLKKVFTN